MTTESTVTNPDTPERDRGGAPAGNTNALTTGASYLFKIGRPPRGGTGAYRSVLAMQRELTAFINSRDGSVSLYQAALINTAATHECRARLIGHYLREATDAKTVRRTATSDKLAISTVEASGISVMDRSTLLEKIGRARDQRDNCLRLLGLDLKPNADPWKAIRATAWPADASSGEHVPEPSDVPSNAPTHAVGDSGGAPVAGHDSDTSARDRLLDGALASEPATPVTGFETTGGTVPADPSSF